MGNLLYTIAVVLIIIWAIGFFAMLPAVRFTCFLS